MPSDFLWALVNPFAPMPANWPGGIWGAFLIFLIPVGPGAPLGVIMARDAIPSVIGPFAPGWLLPLLTPVVIAGMYLVSDLIIVLTYEPMFLVLSWLGRIVPVFARIRDFLAVSTGRAGLKGTGMQGPFRLMLISMIMGQTFGRGVTAAAGHGSIIGWTLATIGDVASFLILMMTTLWLSGMFGDDRLAIWMTVGILIVVATIAQHRLMPTHQRPRSGSSPPPRPGPLQPAPVPVAAGAVEAAPQRIADRPAVSPSGPPRSKKARRKHRH